MPEGHHSTETETDLQLGIGKVEEVHLAQADVAEQLLAVPDQRCTHAHHTTFMDHQQIKQLPCARTDRQTGRQTDRQTDTRVCFATIAAIDSVLNAGHACDFGLYTSVSLGFVDICNLHV